MGRYEIILGKKASAPLSGPLVDIGKEEGDKTAVSLHYLKKVFLVADSPTDVVMTKDGVPVNVKSVNGHTGEVILEEIPDDGTEIVINYYYDQEKCFPEKEAIDIIKTFSPVLHVSNVPMVKSTAVSKIEMREMTGVADTLGESEDDDEDLFFKELGRVHE